MTIVIMSCLVQFSLVVRRRQNFNQLPFLPFLFFDCNISPKKTQALRYKKSKIYIIFSKFYLSFFQCVCYNTYCRVQNYALVKKGEKKNV